jgi:Ca2+-dependent lipid-binding protein
VLLSVKWIHNKDLISPVDKPVDYNDPPFAVVDHDPAKEPNELNVFIIKAYNIKIMDKNLLSKGGSTDPVFSMVLGEESLKTKVIKKNLNPEYNEKFTLGMRSAAGSLKVVCDDYDMGSGNDFVGQCEIPLEGLADRKEVRAW